MTQPGIRYKGILNDKFVEISGTNSEAKTCYFFRIGDMNIELFDNLVTKETAVDLFLSGDAHPTQLIEVDVYKEIGHACFVSPISLPRESTKFVRMPLTSQDESFLLHYDKNFAPEVSAGIKESGQAKILYKERTLLSETTLPGMQRSSHSYRWICATINLKVSEGQYATSKAGEKVQVNRLPKSGFVWYDKL